MKFILFIFLFHYSMDYIVSQSTINSEYREIPELSEKINLTKSDLEFGSARILLHNNDHYEKGVIFGSSLRFVVDDIQESTSFDGYNFMLFMITVTDLESDEVIIELPWTTETDEKNLTKSNGKSNIQRVGKLSIGAPMKVGKYEWKIQLADMCNQRLTSMSVILDVIENPSIQIEPQGSLKYDVGYIYNSTEDFYYTTDSINVTTNQFVIAGLQGFKTENNIAQIGISAKLIDLESNDIVLEVEDLFDGEKSFVQVREDGKIDPNFKFTLDTGDFKKTYRLELYVWDKRDEGNSVRGEYLFFVK